MPITLDGTTGITSPAIDLTVTPLTIVDGGTGTSSTTFTNLTTNVTGTLPIANGGTGATSLAAATISTLGYTTTATAAGTTTLTAASTATQFFTGATTQTVVLPVASTMTQGQQFIIHNNSTGSLTINSSGANLVGTLTANTTATITCILTTGTTAASWDFDLTGFTTALPTARGGTGLTTIGTANQVLAVNAGATALEFQTAGGGSLQAQLFTAPGTWTKPASATQVNVVVIGGGGGAQASGTPTAPSGGSSSFGPTVSCTGGAGASESSGQATPGAATVSSGTVLRSGAVVQSPKGYGPGPSPNFTGSFYTHSYIQGAFFFQSPAYNKTMPSFAGQSYTTSLGIMAGSMGSGSTNQGGSGGLAVVTGVPVTGPVTVTVGGGGNGSHPSVSGGGIGGAVLVEFVG